MSTPPTPVMLFGKLPSQGDFVRVGMSGEAGLQLEAWLGHAVEQSRGRVPESPVRVIAKFSPNARLLAGTWVPSSDSVGRAFPFAIFRDVEDELAIAPLSCLPSFLAPWLDRLEVLARMAAGAPLALTASDAAAADLGHASMIPAITYRNTAPLACLRVRELAEQLFTGAHALDQLAYGVSTVKTAVERCYVASDMRVTLDFPCASETHAFVWLEVLRRAMARTPLAFVVALETLSHRMLVTLGGASDTLLTLLLTPDHPSHERWPLWTTRDEAASRARAALPRQAAEILEGDGTVDHLLAALEH